MDKLIKKYKYELSWMFLDGLLKMLFIQLKNETLISVCRVIIVVVLCVLFYKKNILYSYKILSLMILDLMFSFLYYYKSPYIRELSVLVLFFMLIEFKNKFVIKLLKNNDKRMDAIVYIFSMELVKNTIYYFIVFFVALFYSLIER